MAESLQLKSSCLRERLTSSHSAQASFEYLLMVAITFAIIVPTTYLFYNYSRESSQELTDAQIVKVGRSIVDAAESIFYSGQGSKTVLELNVPDNVESAVVIEGRELVFNISTAFGVSEVVFFTNSNISTIPASCDAYKVCNIHGLGSPGLKKVKLEAMSAGSVRIETI